MSFPASTHDNADPLIVLMITPGLYLHHVEVMDQDPTCGSLYANKLAYLETLLDRIMRGQSRLYGCVVLTTTQSSKVIPLSNVPKCAIDFDINQLIT